MYLKGMLHMKRYLSVDSLSSLHWWVDTSYEVHCDSKGHTGILMPISSYVLSNVSRKHKLNIASSAESEPAESELVSIANILRMVMWFKYFLEAQRYTINMCYIKITSLQSSWLRTG